MRNTSTATTRKLQARLGAVIRSHGSDSREAHAARLDFSAARIAGLIHAAADEHGPFRPQDRRIILDALIGVTPE